MSTGTADYAALNPPYTLRNLFGAEGGMKKARTILAIDVGGSHVKVMTNRGRTKCRSSLAGRHGEGDGARGQGSHPGLVL